MKKKVGILTQPLVNNYGGILQAYALTQILYKLDYIPEIINREFDQKRFFKIKSLIKKLILNKRSWNKIIQDISINTLQFVYDNIPSTKKTYYSRNIHKTAHNKYWAIIVGSDQVWRPKYSPCITNYFLDFCQTDSLKKIAYSASLGVSNWEFDTKETATCSNLIKKFDAISVRENSAIKLCQDYLNVSAVQTLDPTLLLDKEHYINLVYSYNEPPINGDIMCYVLDKTADKENIIYHITNQMQFTSFTVMPKKSIYDNYDNYDENNHFEYEYPKLTRWLRGFIDAKFVITDSFHGCVFAIIFNKPFIAIGNKERGLTRFTSLLQMFGLEDRLIFNVNDLNESILSYRFDWDKINSIKEKLQIQSINFLQESLK
ncbi:polysaccharide pyruvyl transferase family protein [Orbaceae bacterium ESL0727]|nr:polysaccharide pyruvyl transferase family protein [Orbaceae bacterium ESL0727]